MLSKWILVPALLIGSSLFLTASTASAHPHFYHHPHHCYPGPIIRPIVTVPAVLDANVGQFRVIYRPNCNLPWQTYNVYNSQAYAADVVADLQRQSYEAQMVLN